MRIQCPACAATYDVPVHLLKPSQTVRCARCAKEWVPPAEAEGAPLPPLVAEPEAALELAPDVEVRVEPRPIERAAARKPPAVPPPPGVRVLQAAWIASAVVLVALLLGAYSQREVVMKAWPPSIRVYSALGLAERP